jgi:hypothetical protein
MAEKGGMVMNVMNLTTPEEKMAWLWKYVDPSLPNIYAIPRFTPNGCGPEDWRLCGLDIKADKVRHFLGIHFTLHLIPNKFWGLPRIVVCGDLHDYRYQVGGSWADLIKANNELKATMRLLEQQCELLRNHWWQKPWNNLCHERMDMISDAFWAAVTASGHHHFTFREESLRV